MAVSTPTVVCQFLSAASVLTSGAITTAAVPVGAVIEVTAWGAAASTTFGVSDSKSNTWTATTQVGNTGGTVLECIQKFYCFVTTALTTSDTITVTRTVSSSLGFYADYYTGVGAIGGQITNFVTANNSAVTFASPVTAGVGDLVSMGVAAGSTGTGTVGSGYTKNHDAATTVSNARSGANEYQQVAAAGTFSPTFTIGAASQWAATAVALTAGPLPDLVMAQRN